MDKPKPIKYATCRFCQRSDLVWERHEDKFVMFESFGLPHLCDEKDKHFEGIKAANKKQYEDFKAETLAKVGQKCITCGGHGILLGVVHMSGPGHACFNCGGSGTFTEQRAKQLITEKRFQIWPALRYKR